MSHENSSKPPAEFATSDSASPFMRASEVAAYFGTTTRTLFNWERAGLLNARRIGRTKFYLRAEVEALGVGE